MPHVQYPLDTTWTTRGRNVLFEAAMNRNQTYLYYVFMDDDFALGDPRQLIMGPWRRVESSLRSYRPAIAAIDNGWVPRIHFHAERQCSSEAAEFIGTVWFDAICNAFHYKAIRHILPYSRRGGPVKCQSSFEAKKYQTSTISKRLQLHSRYATPFDKGPRHTRPYFPCQVRQCHYTAMEDDGSNGTRLQLAYFMFTVCSIP